MYRKVKEMKNNVRVEEIISIINSVLEDEVLTISDIDKELKDIGLDSIKFVLLIVELEDRYQIEIPDEYMLYSKMSTLLEVQKIVNELVNTI